MKLFKILALFLITVLFLSCQDPRPSTPIQPDTPPSTEDPDKPTPSPDPNPEPPAHEHTYSKDWTTDETYHWHNASCEHTDEISSKAEHVFDENATCLICGYTKTTENPDPPTPSPDPDPSPDPNPDPTPDPEPDPTPQEKALSYTYSNNSYTVTGLGTITTSDITIPQAYNDGRNGEHPVTKIGNRAFYTKNITSVIFPDTITEIGDYAFYSTNITSVIFPDSLTAIGENAFAYAPLKSVKMGNSIETIKAYAFSHCTNLSEINWSEKLTTIGNNAFEYTTSLKTLILPASLKEIGNGGFYRTNITTLRIGENLNTLGSNAFGSLQNLETLIYEANELDTTTRFQNLQKLNFIQIGENVKSMPSEFFTGCSSLSEVRYNATNALNMISLFKESSLKTITFSDSVQSIPPYLCQFATKLTSVNLGENIGFIGQQAFEFCSSLKSITLPTTLTRINAFAFRETGLTEITIPEGIVFIESNAFRECADLKTVYWNATNYARQDDQENEDSYEDFIDKYEGGVFERSNVETLIFGNGANIVPAGLCTDIKTLSTVSLSDSIDTIEYGAFAGCTGLLEINIPKGVRTIGLFAFRQAENIYSITFEEGLTEIEDYAFLLCRDIREVVLPDSLKKMSNAFAECTYMTSFHIGKNLEEIVGSENFVGSTTLETLTVDEANPAYTAIDNVLYNKNKTILMFYTPLKKDAHFEIPNTVETINANAFRDTVNLENVTIPSSVRSIGEYAFMGSSIRNVIIPDSVTELYSTFEDCMALETIHLGKNVSRINIDCFYGLVSLQSFTVNSENQYYSSINGNLFNKDGNTLIKYALGKSDGEFVIDSSITKITYGAFVGSDALYSIRFENTDNWYISNFEDMSGTLTKVTGLDDSTKMAEALADTDYYGNFYWEYRPETT